MCVREGRADLITQVVRLMLLLLINDGYDTHRGTDEGGHGQAGSLPFPEPSHSPTPTTYPLNEPSIPLRPAIRGHNTIKRAVVTPKALQAEADHHGVVLCLWCVC